MPLQCLSPPSPTPSPSLPTARGRGRRLAAIALLGVLAACGRSGGSLTQESEEEPPTDPDAPANLSYATPVLIAIPGVAIDAQTPTVDGSELTYSAAPTLPTWLALDAATGELSGTPTEISPATHYQIIATNQYGSTETTLSVRVAGFARFAYSVNGGDNTISIHTVDAASGALAHHGYVVQSLAEGAPREVQVDPRQRFLFVASDFAVTPFEIDGTTGQLTGGAAIPVGTGPHSLFIHPSGEYLYLSSAATDQLRAFSIDETSGALTEIDQEFTGDGPISLAGDPAGRYLILLHDPGEVILSYAIDSDTGELEQSSTLSIAGVEFISGLVDPMGENLYVLLTEPFDGVARYLVEDPATGSIKAQTAATTGNDPVAMSLAPDGDFLYMLNRGSASITVFTVEGETGNLGDEAQVFTTVGTVSLDFSADGSVAYTSDEDADRIRLFDVDPDTGDLTEAGDIRGRLEPGGLDLQHGDLPVNRRAAQLYVVNSGSDDITHYTIDQATGEIDDGGALAAAAGSTPTDLALDPLGRFAFVTNSGSHEITVFSVGPDGTLTDNLTTFSVPNGGPAAAVVEPSGRFLYVTLPGWELVLQLDIGSDGTLLEPDTRPIGGDPDSIAVDPTGQFLYVIDSGDQITTFGHVGIFAINPWDGALTAVTPDGEAPGGPTMLTLAPGGDRAYATASVDGLVRPYDVEDDGTITFIAPGTAALVEPTDIAISFDGKFAFVAVLDSAAVGSVLVFDVDPSTGAVFDSTSGAPTWRTQVLAGTNPRDVEVSVDGGFLYVLSGTSEEVDVFSFDPETAALTPVQMRQPGTAPVRMRAALTVE